MWQNVANVPVAIVKWHLPLCWGDTSGKYWWIYLAPIEYIWKWLCFAMSWYWKSPPLDTLHYLWQLLCQDPLVFNHPTRDESLLLSFCRISHAWTMSITSSTDTIGSASTADQPQNMVPTSKAVTTIYWTIWSTQKSARVHQSVQYDAGIALHAKGAVDPAMVPFPDEVPVPSAATIGCNGSNHTTSSIAQSKNTDTASGSEKR